MEEFATVTRRYAKQQMVWYRGAYVCLSLSTHDKLAFSKVLLKKKTSHMHT